MKELIQHEAGYLAIDEAAKGRATVILFPRNWGAIAFEMGSPPENVFIRFAGREDGLRSLPMQTLITVNDHWCDLIPTGVNEATGYNECLRDVEPYSPFPHCDLLLAKERLRGCQNPKWIRIRHGEETQVFTNKDIWE